MSRTQKQIILDLLAERGERGVSAREAIYDLHITRLASIIFDLRQEGWRIESVQAKGETARYILSGVLQKSNARLCGTCSHRYRVHVAGMKCLAEMGIERIGGPLVYCPCQQFTEAREA